MAGSRATFAFGGFASRYRDGIDFNPGPPPRLVNRNVIRSDGVEALLRVKMTGALEWMFSGTYADVRSEPGGGPLRGRPRTEGSVRAVWRPAARFTLEASVTAMGNVFDSSMPTGDVFLPDWRRPDVAGRYQIRRDLTLTVAVDNLFDTRFEEAIGVPSPGVRFRGGVEARF